MTLRDYRYEIMQEIKDRWSPRAISPEPIPWEDVEAVVDAARQAPSCFNEQPWRFIVADEGEMLEQFRNLLAEKNQLWAGKAPVLIVIASCKTFESNGKINRWSGFDTGTAWGYLALEATRRGYVTHAMAGFDAKKTAELLGMEDAYEPIAMVAMGRYGNPEELNPMFRDGEQPNRRNSLESVLIRAGQPMR